MSRSSYRTRRRRRRTKIYIVMFIVIMTQLITLLNFLSLRSKRAREKTTEEYLPNSYITYTIK